MVKRDKLQKGATYILEDRNMRAAVWDGELFLGHRMKFGGVIAHGEHHWDDGGCARPIRKLTKADLV